MENLGALFSNLPATASVIISVLAIGLTWFLNYKKVVVDNKNSFNNVQQAQVKGLMEQIELLSRELTNAREQLVSIHNQNLNLMEQARLASRRTSELEQQIQNFKNNPV